MRNSLFPVILSMILLVGCSSKILHVPQPQESVSENGAATAGFTPHGLDVYLPGVYSLVWSTEDPTGGKRKIEGGAVIKRILDGQFIEVDFEISGFPFATGKTLIQYRANLQTYVAWFFRANGVAITVESRPSNQEPRTNISEGFLGGLKYKGSTTWSKDYREIVDTYQWYDPADRLVRTDVAILKLLELQPIAPRESPPASRVK